jgi:hypothetical protein
MREFGLRSYAKALEIYGSNRAYWENLYGSDPLNSSNHPDSPPKSLLPRQPGASNPGYNLLDPAAPGGAALGPFGTRGQFAPGTATSSQPLYETQSFVPPIGPTRSDAAGDNTPSRQLVGRIADRPATFNERFQAALSPTGASSGDASPDDLETFRRTWLKTFLDR